MGTPSVCDETRSELPILGSSIDDFLKKENMFGGAKGRQRVWRATRGSEMATVDMVSPRTGLPYLKVEFAVAIDHFEIGAVRSDQAGAMRAGGERDEHVEMQIAELIRCKTAICANFSQYLPRLQPILFRGSQGWMIPAQGPQKFLFRWLHDSTPQLSHDHGRIPDEAVQGLDSPPIMAGAYIIHQNGRVEDDEVTHQGRRMRASLHTSS